MRRLLQEGRLSRRQNSTLTRDNVAATRRAGLAQW